MNVTLAGISQIVGGVFGGGLLVTLVTAWTNRGKVAADAESISIATANALMSGMRQDITDLRTRVARQDATIMAYGRRVDYLTGLLLRSGVAVEDWSTPT